MARAGKAVVGGAVMAAACLLAVYAASRSHQAYERERTARETHLMADQIASRMRANLEQHRVALEQLANFFENSEGVDEARFAAYAGRTVDLAPLFLRFVVIDPDARVRWVYPAAPNRALVGRDLKTNEGYETILRARGSRKTVLSPPIDLLDGPQGFVMVAPAVRRGERLGEIAGTFRASEFFRTFVLPRTHLDYEERVSDSGRELFSTPNFGDSDGSIPVGIESVRMGGRTWEVRLRPRDEVFVAAMSAGQTAYWVVGGMLAISLGVLAGGAVYGGSTLFARLRDHRAALDETRRHLDTAKERLLHAEKLTAVGELVAGVAHEINNPLTTILGYSQLLASEETRPEQRRRLELVASEAERTGKIVRNLLTFARKNPPEKTRASLNEVVATTLELKEYHLRANRIELERDLDGDLPSTMLDFQQIQQVLLNLLNNAEHAILDANRPGRIRVATRREGEMLEARVTDDGPGIPPEIRERIFEPFFTTKTSGAGTGLGLSLCSGIVSEHGGTLSLEDGEGPGTTFVVRLPLLEAVREGEEAAPAPPPASGKLRILVIDDEPAIRELLVERLRGLGHVVREAGDVPPALALLSKATFDLVISDMKMPGGSGRDVFDAITRRAPALARRIVFTTGDGASPETRRFFEDAGSVVVLKPFRFEEIERVIAALTTR